MIRRNHRFPNLVLRARGIVRAERIAKIVVSTFEVIPPLEYVTWTTTRPLLDERTFDALPEVGDADFDLDPFI